MNMINMSNLYNKAESEIANETSTTRRDNENDDLVSCEPDDMDTSFEIDDPEDEEIVDNGDDGQDDDDDDDDGGDVNEIQHNKRRVSMLDVVSTTLNHITDAVFNHINCIHHTHNLKNNDTLTSTCKLCSISRNSNAITQACTKNDNSEQSDTSIISRSATWSTPTTDPADNTSIQTSGTQRVKCLSPLLHHANTNANASANANTTEDNLSCSIATTITDIDLDNTTTTTTTTTATVLASADGNHEIKPTAAFRLYAGEASTSKNHRRNPSASSNSSRYPHDTLPHVQTSASKMRCCNWIQWISVHFKSSGIGEPSVYHALVVIFLEFFAWGLLAMPVIAVLNQTFPDHTFLMNGLVMGIKGILSFLSAPLVGALSDIWGRKFFLLITVFFTCAPIPLMSINTWWFFAMISISGVFAVTFSVVFAYVADVTTVEERSRAYGLVSATFAASLVISPALGALLMEVYSETLVVALATAIAVLDVFFILVAVPESLPEKVRPSSWGAPISWEQADPFAALRKVGTDHTILMQCVTVLLSYLPEAGQYSCIFVYLKLKMGFNSMEVAIFIAVVGILSISVQVTLGYLMRVLGPKNTIIVGLILEMLQLLWYGFGSQSWMMWAAGVLAALGSITYPAISAFVSIHSTPDRQGAVQGMVTGMRGLCNGLGPAMFGVIFYLFNVDLNDDKTPLRVGGDDSRTNENVHQEIDKYTQLMPGPPFVFGAFMVILAIIVAVYIPDQSEINIIRAPSEKKRVSVDGVQYEIERGNSTSPRSPLMHSDTLVQL